MAQPQSQRDTQHDRSHYAHASMVTAIVSLPAALVVGFGAIFGAAAIALGIFSRRSKKRHLAIFGILVGAIGTAVSIASVVLWIVLWQSSR